MPIPRPLLRALLPFAALAILACASDGPQSPDVAPLSTADTSAVRALESSLDCSPGTYDNGGENCVYAPVGYYMPYSGYTYAFSCPLPFTTAGIGSTAASHCNVMAPPGSFVSPETHVITPCPAGQYQPYAGEDFCYSAPAGTYTSGTGATGYIQCSSGTYSTGGAASCTPAPAGYRVSGSGLAFPTACAPGTFQPNTGSTSCLLSPAGSYVPFSAATQPTLCSAGFYQPAMGASSCLPAPAGRFVPGTGATSPTDCAIGSYQPLTGQSACLPAPIGSYVAVVGAAAATPCPAGTTTRSTGATSAAQCVTAFTLTGFYAPVDNAPALNVTKAGAAIPVKFALGGNYGLDVLDPGYPMSQAISCSNAATLAAIEETASASSNGLTYDATTDRYTYVWKTDKSWSGSCRRLTLVFTDGTTKSADFMFK